LYSQSKPNIYRGNTFIRDPAANKQVQVRTSAYTPEKVVGLPSLQSTDTWDKNTYYPAFSGSLQADSATALTGLNLAKWRMETCNRGKCFDGASVEHASPVPSANRIVINKNEYDGNRSHMAIYNWAGQTSVAVDLSPVLSTGVHFEIYDIEN